MPAKQLQTDILQRYTTANIYTPNIYTLYATPPKKKQKYIGDISA